MHGKFLAHMTVDYTDFDEVAHQDKLHFFYDAQSRPAKVSYNGTMYTYVLNGQGDVAGLLDNSGTLVVEYQYNAWGALQSLTGTLADTLGKRNPLRYHGYIHDEETELYYLQSRYYSPTLQRLINADAAVNLDEDLLAHNLFTYCLNDPINRSDESGSWSLPNWAKVAIGAALVVTAAVVATVATGGVACFAAGAAIGAAKGAVSGAIGGAVTGVISNRIRTGSWEGSLEAAVDGAADGFMYGAVSGFIMGGLSSKACFVAGTLISAAHGLKPIETIQSGEFVWAEDPETGERALKRVVRTFLNEKDELVHVQVNGETITCTTEHPFYVRDKGWVAADELKIGDKLELQSGEDAFIEAVHHEKLAKPIQVYNFEVDDFHTYYVGPDCVLVHNVCKGNWSRGSNDTPEANMMKHYKKHGLEVGANSPAEYTRKAMNYANDVLSKGRRVRTARISGYTDGVVRYYYNRKYIDLVRNGAEHLIVSFGRR